MKKINLLTMMVGLFTTLGIAQVSNYNVGDVVDDFTVTDVHGVEHNLYTYLAEGKYVYLDFFFDTCVPCQTTTPIFNEFYDKYGCNEGDVFCISINNGTDTNAEVLAFEQAYGGPFNHAPAVSSEGGSGDVDNDFGVNAYPTYCLIGPDSTLLVKDIWPLTGVETFEDTFPVDFDPPIMACSLGVTDSAGSFNFAVYPTPSNGTLNIQLINAMPTEVVVYDIMGRNIFENNFDDQNIQLRLEVTSGTYFVRVYSEEGFATKTILIQ